MPIGFWNDPDGAKYRAAYFERFDNVWCHGDFAEWTEHGGLVIHGRSDATLNPGGVRIGTAEIYNQVEQLPEVAEALCIGQDWDDDVRVVLFVRLAAGVALDDEPGERASAPRSAPAPARATCRQRSSRSPTFRAPSPARSPSLRCATSSTAATVKNSEALANPEALELFRDLRAAEVVRSIHRLRMVNERCLLNLPRFHEWYTFVKIYEFW